MDYTHYNTEMSAKNIHFSPEDEKLTISQK